MEVRLEAFSASGEYGTVTRWYKAETESVNAGEPLLEVETDKVMQDVVAPASGTVREILVMPGDEVPVGTVLAIIETGAA